MNDRIMHRLPWEERQVLRAATALVDVETKAIIVVEGRRDTYMLLLFLS